MSTSAITGNSIHQDMHTYLQERNSDLKKLGQALMSGDLAAARQQFAAIRDLAQNSPFGGGREFGVGERQNDFAAIGQALQSGDLQAAQQAFAELRSTALRAHTEPPPVVFPMASGNDAPAPATSSAPGNGLSVTA